jgi:patatin-like phospholipase/acyl hydrolase
MGKPFKILSIDGGGIRGVYPAHLLRCIEDRLQISLLDTFDMFAGTSTGSIIAAGIVSGVSSSKIVEMYEKHGEHIFKKRSFPLPFKKVLQPMFGSIYDSNYLEKILEDVFEDKTLGEIEKPLLLPSTDIGNGCVHVLKSHYDKSFTRDKSVLIKDAVLASSSAPIYFDPRKVDKYLLSDGGLWANNPSLAAVIDAQKRLGVAQSDIRIFSIGTGHSKTSYGTDRSRKWGLVNGWKHKDFINFILSLQSQSAMNYLNLMMRPDQVMRIDFESDKTLPLDDPSAVSDLISKADHHFSHRSEAIMSFISVKEDESSNDNQ